MFLSWVQVWLGTDVLETFLKLPQILLLISLNYWAAESIQNTWARQTFFSSHRIDFRPVFPHSRAQDVKAHVRDVLRGQILRKLASAANPSQT